MSHKTYLSGFTTCLGERRPIAELPQLREDANVAAYLAKSGFESYRRSAQSPAHMAEQCLRALKEKLPQRFARIDAIVYASVTVSDGRFFNEHLGEALCAVGLGQTNLTGLFASQCGNLGNALMLARMMILTGQAACVLVVVTDACMDERQRVYDGNVVVSDGASCLLVDSECGDFELLDTGQSSNHQLRISTSAENLPRYLKQSSEGIRACLERLFEAQSVQRGQVARLVTNHYARSVLGMFAYLADMDAEAVYAPGVADVGHAFSCDICLGLERLAHDPALSAGQQLICLSTGKSTWFASLLTKT